MSSLKILLTLVSFLLICNSCSLFESECDVCDGTGKAECTSCNGTGKSNCYICNGQGSKPCTDCDGGKIRKYVANQYKDGYQYVFVPGYSGYTQVISGYINADCSRCNSSGKLKCLYCNDGKQKCNWCYGDGKKTCLNCNGKGKK